MKAKLIKTVVNYLLEDSKGVVIGSTSTKEINKLSKQNCDEIFGVVDVEKLAEDFAKNNSIYPTAQDDTEYGFKYGFKKAMEFNKDKVFTLEDMRKAIEMSSDIKYVTFSIDEIIQSLQQPTEIEVMIVMKKVVDETKVIGAVKGIKGSGDKITTYKSVPKLDSEGCIILKKI